MSHMNESWATIVADSITEDGHRITSVQTNAPRIIHSELLRHRMFSFSAGSSRAVPVKRMLERVRTNPAMPARFGANQPGMQDKGEGHIVSIEYRPWNELGYSTFHNPRRAWEAAADTAADWAQAFADAGYHKQVANRLIEPFQFLPCLVTATEWDNFFELRDHDDAEPTIRKLAVDILEAMNKSRPQLLRRGEWHLPYVKMGDWELASVMTQGDPQDILVRVSAARCARNSYLNHDGKKSTIEEDLSLFDRLVGSKPWHASPLEHQARPASKRSSISRLSIETLRMWTGNGMLEPWEIWEDFELQGNFRGWCQYRKFYEKRKNL